MYAVTLFGDSALSLSKRRTEKVTSCGSDRDPDVVPHECIHTSVEACSVAHTGSS
jgi:hypothetical protein